MLRVLTTVAITARMLVTARMMIVRPCSLLQHKKWTNTKWEKIKGRENHHQNLHHQIQRILPLQKNQSRKVILLKATEFKSSKSESQMGASWWNGRLCESPVWVIHSRKRCKRKSSGITAHPWMSGASKNWTIL